MKNEYILACKASQKLSDEEIELVTGAGINFGNCNFYDFNRSVAGNAVVGGLTGGRFGGFPGAFSGATFGAFTGAAYYGATCWW